MRAQWRLRSPHGCRLCVSPVGTVMPVVPTPSGRSPIPRRPLPSLATTATLTPGRTALPVWPAAFGPPGTQTPATPILAARVPCGPRFAIRLSTCGRRQGPLDSLECMLPPSVSQIARPARCSRVPGSGGQSPLQSVAHSPASPQRPATGFPAKQRSVRPTSLWPADVAPASVHPIRRQARWPGLFQGTGVKDSPARPCHRRQPRLH